LFLKFTTTASGLLGYTANWDKNTTCVHRFSMK
jgi:hypothetical protein